MTSTRRLLAIIAGLPPLGCASSKERDVDVLLRAGSTDAAPARPAEASETPNADEAAKACQRRVPSGLLPLGCPPEYGEDNWGHVGNLARNLRVEAAFVSDCFRSIAPSGSSSFIPPRSKPCRLSPTRKCVLVDRGKGEGKPWEFSLPTPEEDPAWHLVGVTEHYYWEDSASNHIRFHWSNDGGRCEVWVEAVADLDNDGYESRYVIGEFQKDGTAVGEITRRELREENPERRGPGQNGQRHETR